MTAQTADSSKQQFIFLVSMLSMTAMRQMGKLIDPGTGQAELQLEAAQATIDVLEMLAVKTKGNLDKDENRMLQDSLMDLRMNFVQTIRTAESEQTGKEGTEPAASNEDNAATEKPEDQQPD